MKKTAPAEPARKMNSIIQEISSDDKDLEKSRQLLNNELDEALKKHELLHKTLLRYHNTPKKAVTFIMNENDSEVFTLEELTGVAENNNQLIRHLQYSLERMGTNKRGSSEITGKLIAKEALKMVPVTTAGYREGNRA